MDFPTLITTTVSSVAVSVATAYITTRIRMREEAQKWQRDFAVQRAVARASDPQAAERMGTSFAIGFLIVHRGDSARDRVFLAPGDRLVVGAGTDNPIVMTDPAFSRRHLAFDADDTSASVIDLGSTNGVYVNGVRVVSRQALADGDRITVTMDTRPSQFFTFHYIAATRTA